MYASVVVFFTCYRHNTRLGIVATTRRCWCLRKKSFRCCANAVFPVFSMFLHSFLLVFSSISRVNVFLVSLLYCELGGPAWHYGKSKATCGLFKWIVSLFVANNLAETGSLLCKSIVLLRSFNVLIVMRSHGLYGNQRELMVCWIPQASAPYECFWFPHVSSVIVSNVGVGEAFAPQSTSVEQQLRSVSEYEINRFPSIQ